MITTSEAVVLRATTRGRASSVNVDATARDPVSILVHQVELCALIGLTAAHVGKATEIRGARFDGDTPASFEAQIDSGLLDSILLGTALESTGCPTAEVTWRIVVTG